MDNNTRRYPRTIEQAFGPYQFGPLVDNDRRPTLSEAVAFAAFAAIVLAASVVIFFRM